MKPYGVKITTEFPDTADIQGNALQSSVGKLKSSLRSKIISEEEQPWKGKYQKGYLRTKSKKKIRRYWKRKARIEGREKIREQYEI
jgi:hypothetical protein